MMNVHRSSRSRTALALAGLALLGGCAGQRATAEDTRATSPVPELTSASPRWDGKRLGDSTWRRVVTVEDAKALGAWTPGMRADFGDDGRLTVTVRLVDSRFAVSGDYGDGADEVGDLGTVDYDEQGRMEWVSESGGCPGCRATIAWTLDGDMLRTRLVRGSAGRPFDPDERLMLVGTWMRAD